jgi:hypothetical protein
MTHLRPLLVVFIVSAVALVAACGGDDSPPSEQPTPVLSEEELQALAESALLRLDDFPLGWVARPPEADDDDLPDECQALIAEDELPGTLVEAESDEFIGPDEEEVSSSAAILVDAQMAQETMALLRGFLDECREPFRQALLQYMDDLLAEEEDDELLTAILEGVEFSFQFDPLSFPALGDDSVAYRMQFGVEAWFISFDMYIDMIFMTVDRVGAALFFQTMDSVPDPEHQETLARVVEERARRVAAALGG